MQSPRRYFSAHVAAPAACAGVSILVRGIAYFFYRQSPLLNPPEGSVHDRSIYQSAIDLVASGTFFPEGAFDYLPLYPWLMGIFSIFAGSGPAAIATFGIACDAATTACIFLLARRLGAKPVLCGLAALAYAFYPLAVVYSLLSMPNTLNALCVTGFALTVQYVIDRNHHHVAGKRSAHKAMFGLGFYAGVTTLGFAGMLMMASVAALILAIKLRMWSVVLAFAFGMAIPIAPVAIHNSRAEGQVVLLTTHGGLNFYMGNHELATGYPLRIRDFRMSAKHLLEDAHRYAEDRSGRTLSRAESSAWWSGEARQFWREHPLFGIVLSAKKVALFWNQIDVDDLRVLEQLKITESAFRNWIGVPFAVFGILGLTGLLLAQKSGVHKIMLLAGMIGLVMFFITARYRLTFVPLMAVLGAVGLSDVGALWRSHHRVKLIVVMPILVLVFFPVPLRDLRPVDHYNAAIQLMATGQIDKALIVITRGLKIDPEFADLHFARGNLLFRREDFKGAVEAYAQALLRNPNNPTAIFNFALSMARSGDICGARDALLEMQARRMPIDDRARRLLADLNASCEE